MWVLPQHFEDPGIQPGVARRKFAPRAFPATHAVLSGFLSHPPAPPVSPLADVFPSFNPEYVFFHAVESSWKRSCFKSLLRTYFLKPWVWWMWNKAWYYYSSAASSPFQKNYCDYGSQIRHPKKREQSSTAGHEFVDWALATLGICQQRFNVCNRIGKWVVCMSMWRACVCVCLLNTTEVKSNKPPNVPCEGIDH